MALYHPDHGFYASGGQAGRRGDFLTSPEVGPLFGAVVARALETEWDRLGRPRPFTVVDGGAGPGTLARSVLAAEPRCGSAMHYVCVEVSRVQRAAHPDGVESRDTMPEGPITGVVLANELLDNLPFTPIDPAGRHARVTLDGDRPAVEWHEVPGRGAGAPFDQTAAIEWLASARRILDRGRVVVFDYCRTRSADVGVRTFAGHGPAGDPLEALGTKDITIDVDLEQLQAAVGPADAVRSQSEWLGGHGLDELVEAGRAAWEAGAAAGDLAALRGRSRVREAEALTDSGGLGGFTVAEWVSG